MINIFNIYDKLRLKKSLTAEDIFFLENSRLADYQKSSLVVRLINKSLTPSEKGYLEKVLNSDDRILAYVKAGYPEIGSEVRRSCYEMERHQELLLKATTRVQPIGKKLIEKLISDYVNGSIKDDFMAFWLMCVCCHGLDEQDVVHLTCAMAYSGPIYDYRTIDSFKGKKMVRRYPTGALSEKVALILPSLLSAVANEYNILSPFLVAKSLSFTGGTWDKLSAIPGFQFPHPGKESIDCMKQASVAMTVTKGDCNQADRLIYKLRSVTGTVESLELIVASIASKHIAIPVDLLLMDIRYGKGAFIEEKAEAELLGVKIQNLLKQFDINSIFRLKDTEQPNGMAIGNSLEVLEAIAVMQMNTQNIWREEALREQWNLVADFFSLIMQQLYPEMNENHWQNLASKKLNDGLVYSSFLKILKAHMVSDSTIKQLSENPFDLLLGENSRPNLVHSSRDFVLKNIDQRKLGYFANFGLADLSEDVRQIKNLNSGVVLNKRLHETVKKGDVLCYIYGLKDNSGNKWIEEVFT